MKAAIKIIGVLLVIGIGIYTYTYYINLNPQNRAERAVNSYLKENLPDPSGYKSISFNKLDTLTPIGHFGDTTVKEQNNTAALFDSISAAGNPHYHDRDPLYSIFHVYRAKNEYGGYSIFSETFELDKDFEVVYAG